MLETPQQTWMHSNDEFSMLKTAQSSRHTGHKTRGWN